MDDVALALEPPQIAGPRPAPAQGWVLVHLPSDPQAQRGHETLSRVAIARQLAALLGYRVAKAVVAGDTPHLEPHPGPASRAFDGAPVYHVPDDTLVGFAAAARLRIGSERDLYGGWVPHAFVATKAITHPLVSRSARAPAGWSPRFAQRVAHAALPGYTAFSIDDARAAGGRLLQRGALRVKAVCARGGHGQVEVRDATALEEALATLDAREIARHGVVLEENLEAPTTWSVGCVSVGALRIAYWGTQRLTQDNAGATVYGGSDLEIVRGDFDALLALALPEGARRAIERARRYDAAALESFPRMIASRRNYDVAEGVGCDGARRCGVLEQSWRLGGASGPEVAALLAFRDDASLRRVRASSVERFGDGHAAPPGAMVLFDGVDPGAGRLLKYTVLDR